MNDLFKHLALACAIATLTGCGGGGGGGSDPDPQPQPEPEPEPIVAPVTGGASLLGSVLTGEGTVLTLAPDNDNPGQFLTDIRDDLDGFTLYIFDNDPPGESNCDDGTCVGSWPPLLVEDGSEASPPFGFIDRADGNRQWALRDKPLYYFAGDTQPGDINGDDFGGVWHVATSQPVLLNKFDPVVDPDGDPGEFLVASGNVLTFVPEVAGDFSRFVAQRQNRERFSLYTFDLDEPGVSNCGPGSPDTAPPADCLDNWPPLMADADDIATPPYSIIDRIIDDQGNTARQWAYHDRPLYFFKGDEAAGQTNGANLPNWRLARPIPLQAVDSALGEIIAGHGRVRTLLRDNGVFEPGEVIKEGFSLYTFTDDEPDVSNCEGDCLQVWPPLIAHAGAEPQPPFSLITRSTEEKQWAINGMPLYFFGGDNAAGQTNGDGVVAGTGGIWHLARVAPVAIRVVERNSGEEVTAFVGSGNLVDANGDFDEDQVQGLTLYTFDEDPVGETTCFGNCLGDWSALYAPADAVGFGKFGVIERDDEGVISKQWTYKGKPLYYFIADNAPGDTGGDYPTWTIAQP